MDSQNIKKTLQKDKSPSPSTPASQVAEMTGMETDNIMQTHLDQMFARLKAERQSKKG